MAAKDKLELVMGLEADRMANLVLTDEVVLPERDVVLEERRQRTENNPAAKLGEMADAAFYLNSPYREPTIGWEHEIRTLGTADAIAFYKTWYASNNAVVIIAGDVKPEAVKAMAERTYGKVAADDVPARHRPQEPEAYAPRRVVLESAQVQQPSWSRRWLAPSHGAGGRPRVYAIQVLSEILGGSTVSRLYRTLAVEQGIATDAGSSYAPDAMTRPTSSSGRHLVPAAISSKSKPLWIVSSPNCWRRASLRMRCQGQATAPGSRHSRAR